MLQQLRTPPRASCENSETCSDDDDDDDWAMSSVLTGGKWWGGKSSDSAGFVSSSGCVLGLAFVLPKESHM